MNNCSFIGRMGSNPKFYQGDQNKKSSLMFSLAVKKDYQVQQGQPDCDWLNFKAFGKQAELLNQYVGKGAQVGITAKAVEEKWKDQQTGADRTAIKFFVTGITFISNNNSNNSNNGGNSGNNNNNGGNSGFSAPYIPDVDDDDLPF